MSRVWYVENTWMCDSCQTSNKGRDMVCTNCGAQKSPDAEEKIGSANEVVTDLMMLKQAKAGSNWVCAYCNGQERNFYNECKNCGGPKTTDGRARLFDTLKNPAEEPLTEQPSVEQRSLPRASVVHDGDYDIRPSWFSIRGVKEWVMHNPLKILLVIVTLAMTVLTLFLVHWLFTPKYVNTKVDSIYWKYTVNLRTREVRHDAEWGRPGDKGFYEESAFNVDCNSKYYGTEDCHPHDCRPHSVSYSCNCVSYSCDCKTTCTNEKNGYSRCSESCGTCNRCSTCYRTEYDTCYDQCPVYRDWCEYDYYEWPISKTISTTGEDHKIYWPTVEFGPLQRLQKIEEYKIKFVCTGDSFEYNPKGLLDFNRFNVGDFWRLQVGKIRSHNIEELQKISAEKE